MIPDGFRYFLNDFWNFRFCCQIWTRGPCSDHQNTSNVQEIWQRPLEDTILTYMNFKKGQFYKRWAPKNDEDSFNKIVGILNMGPISIYLSKIINGFFVISYQYL